MKPREMSRNLERLQKELAPMLLKFMDASRVRLAATSTREYMQDGGYTSPPFPARKSAAGPLRILSGRLARSLTGGRSFIGGGKANVENIAEVQTTKEGVQMRHGTRVPYAYAHEHGFSGTVSVPFHQRTITNAFGKSIPAKTVTVRQHSKKMFIPARPFMEPSLNDNLPWIHKQLGDDFFKTAVRVLDE